MRFFRSGAFLFIFVSLEAKVERFLESINDAKEKVFIPWIKTYWPRWLSPNILTSIRIVIGLPILVPLVFMQGFTGNYLILGLLVFAALTDLIDGPVARALDQKSDFGSLLDKIADKCLILPLGVYEFWFIDKPLAFISVAGMCMVMYTSISRYFHSGGKEVPENIFGKFATMFYCLAITVPILQPVWPYGDSWVLGSRLGWIGLSFGAASAILNGRKHFDIKT